MYKDLIDGESFEAANKFLEVMDLASAYHCFGSSDDVLKDYRRFLTEWQRLKQLPPEIQKMKSVHSFPDMIRGSWGHYCSEWLLNLMQADVDYDRVARYVVDDMTAAGFIPMDYNPFPQENS